jgi:hypothetical protein
MSHLTLEPTLRHLSLCPMFIGCSGKLFAIKVVMFDAESGPVFSRKQLLIWQKTRFVLMHKLSKYEPEIMALVPSMNIMRNDTLFIYEQGYLYRFLR